LFNSKLNGRKLVFNTALKEKIQSNKFFFKDMWTNRTRMGIGQIMYLLPKKRVFYEPQWWL